MDKRKAYKEKRKNKSHLWASQNSENSTLKVKSAQSTYWEIEYPSEYSSSSTNNKSRKLK